MKLRQWLLAAALIGVTPLTGFAQGHTERGAVLGGLGGALAGAAIGKHNGETAAGALLGGAVGLIAGSAIGGAKDDDAARRQAMYQYQAQAAYRAITPQQVVTMTHSGVNPNVIITQIQQNGVSRRLEVSEVIWLHQQGVNEAVITVMQNAPIATAVVAPAPVYSAPVVVEEHYYHAPAPRYYRYPHHHHYHRRPGPTFYGGVTIRN
jgi:hypothetical protein